MIRLMVWITKIEGTIEGKRSSPLKSRAIISLITRSLTMRILKTTWLIRFITESTILTIRMTTLIRSLRTLSFLESIISRNSVPSSHLIRLMRKRFYTKQKTFLKQLKGCSKIQIFSKIKWILFDNWLCLKLTIDFWIISE